MRMHTLNTSKTRLSLRLQTLIIGFCFKLKLGCITFPCLVPIAKHAYFGKKMSLMFNIALFAIKIFIALTYV